MARIKLVHAVKIYLVVLCLTSAIPLRASAQDTRPPNVLFIAIDDLNDWIGALDGHPQVRTPNIDRLAARGVNFTNAHCQAPICMPSRTSLLTGTYPHRNGIYVIEQKFSDAPLLKDMKTLPRYFRDHGYRTMGCGKIYHRSSEHSDDWDEWGFHNGWNWMKQRVGPEGVSDLPNPSIFDFGPINATEQEMNDWKVVDWAEPRLSQRYDRPFFMAIGLITPHLPLFTPEKYFNEYPEATTQLPPTLPGDLDDLPPMGRKFTRYFDSTPMSHHNITRYGVWHKAVASYLATATFSDQCVGRLLDALAASPHLENTIIVLWSDHGFHLGEKMHWEKRSLWEESTRVPLIIALPENQSPRSNCRRPVGLVDIFPTLVELCGLPPLDQLQGRSLVPLLNDPKKDWDHPALTTHHPGNHAVRSERWRYIRYANGEEELYDHETDPHEWHNLAGMEDLSEIKRDLATHLPTKSAPYAPRLPRQKFTQSFDWSTPEWIPTAIAP